VSKELSVNGIELEKTMIELRIPSTVLKDKEKAELSRNFMDSLTAKGVPAVELKDVYYLEQRSATEPLGYLVFLYLSGVADIVTILLAIWTVLKERKKPKEVTVKIGDAVYVKVKGDMSEEEILKLVKEARKGSGKR
jgi:hypothetical protein